MESSFTNKIRQIDRRERARRPALIMRNAIQKLFGSPKLAKVIEMPRRTLTLGGHGPDLLPAA